MPWTKTETQAFGVLLYAIGELYNDPVSTARAELYCGALEDLPFADVKLATERALKTAKFFPKPAELRELVEGRVEDDAELAWLALQREIRRVGYLGTPRLDARVLRAAEGLFGGWRAL